MQKADALSRALDIAIELREVEVPPRRFREEAPGRSTTSYVELTSQLMHTLNEALELILEPELERLGLKYSEFEPRELIARLRASS
jgi:hypothetical protein